MKTFKVKYISKVIMLCKSVGGKAEDHILRESASKLD